MVSCPADAVARRHGCQPLAAVAVTVRYPARRTLQLPLRALERIVMKDDRCLAHPWLARVVREWRPHVIRSFGIDPGSEFYLETRMWFETLPEEIRSLCRTEGRIPRREALDLVAQVRIVLAASLLDGVPNVLLEAMAYGALPIVSPLPALEGIVEDGRHALMARNLCPHEIADALIRAMADDRLVDEAARENLVLVRRIGDRAVAAPRVAAYYRALAQSFGEGA